LDILIETERKTNSGMLNSTAVPNNIKRRQIQLDWMAISNKRATTVCFRDLDKLNLPMVVRFYTYKMMLASKVVKVNSKIIVSLPEI
jgi:hypothetical protein